MQYKMKEDVFMIVLRNCRLIPQLTEGYEGQLADILLEDKVIKRIAPCGTDFQVEAREIDLQQRTLLPGLMDIHAHFNLYSKNVLEALVQDQATAAFEAVVGANEYLCQGYTLVRDCGSS